MRSIQSRFNKIKTKNPYWSSLTCFIETIRGQRFKKDTLHRSFKKLVDKDDYNKNQRKEIFKNIFEANKEILNKKQRYFFTEKYYSK